MHAVRRSLTAVAVGAVALAMLTPGASADESSPSIGKPHVALPATPAISRGLIIQTTTSSPSKSLLKSTDSAMGSEADAVSSKALTGKISTIAFDQTVPESVAEDAAAQVAKRSDVVWAVPDTLRHVTSSAPVQPDDRYFTHQRNVWDDTASSGGYSIKAPDLWRKTKGSDGVVVAVVDTGILADHPDLQGQLVAGYDMIGADQDESSTPMPDSFETAGDGNGRDGDPADPGDRATKDVCGYSEPSSWHGTFVAGMVAAKWNGSDEPGSNSGIAGIAPGVKVQPVRVLGHCGGYDSDIIAGIVWASGGDVDGVPPNSTPSKVINLSLGYTYGDSSSQKGARDSACVAYKAAAQTARANHAIVVAAAGNDGADADLGVPASCDGYLSVGATSLRGFSSWYSNVGSSVDLVAPGGDTLVEGSGDSVLSLANTGTNGPKTNGYARYEGTSMAAPEVSAAAALLYSLGETNPDDVTKTLKASVLHFHSHSTSYAKKKVRINGHNYYFDLNCLGHRWCGSGILDLGKVQVPLTDPKIAGTPIIGEPLSVTQGKWVATPPTFHYTWFRNGTTPVGTSPTYLPTHDDVGSTLTVRVAPSDAGFARFSATSSPTAAVPAGPDKVTLTPPYAPKHGKTLTVHVSSLTTPDGTIEIRRGTHIVMGTGMLKNGMADIEVPGIAWHAGKYPIRAAYLGTDPASSPGVTVTVAKAKATITTSLASSVKTSSHASLHVTVTVTGDTKPTGTLRVYDNARLIVTKHVLTSGNGKKTISLPHLKKGSHSIKVFYLGNSNISENHSHFEHIKAY
jgi:serine protease